MLTFFLLTIAISAAPADPDSAQEAARREEVAKFAPAKARQVTMLVGEEQEAAKLRAEPLLRWSNPTAGSVYGEVFLWSHQGRPAAIASIFRWYHPYKDSTFEVVATTPLAIEAREDKELFWEAKAGAIEFKPLADSPSPAKMASARLNQMRQLARRFSVNLVDKRNGEPVNRELRLLNQPAHRYESAANHVVDGGLFALVEVTDPEVWILLEAVEKKDKSFYQYAIARMNSDACQVRLDEKLVLQWEKIVDPWKYHQAPYTSLVIKPDSVKVEPPPRKLRSEHGVSIH